MTRPCTVCTHPELVEIDKLLASPTRPSYRAIASQYGLISTSLYRHACEHLPEKIAKARDVREMLEADDLLGQTRLFQEVALTVLNDAQGKVDKDGKVLVPRNHPLMLKAAREGREGVRLLGEVQGRLRPQGGDVIIPTTLVVRVYDNGRGINPVAGASVERVNGAPSNGAKRGNGARRR